MHSYCFPTILNPFYSCCHSVNSFFLSLSPPCSISLNAANHNQHTCFQTFPCVIIYNIHQSNALFFFFNWSFPVLSAPILDSELALWSNNYCTCQNSLGQCFSNFNSCMKHEGSLLKMQIQIWWVWSRSWEFAFLTFFRCCWFKGSTLRNNVIQ